MSEHSPGTGLTGFSKFDEQWGVPVFKAIVGELDTAAATGAVGDDKTVMAMVKQLVTAIQQIPTTAMRGTDDAALATDLATMQTDVDHLIDVSMHETAIFPATTGLTCTMTAHADADTWSGYTEIVDSAAAALSTAFASKAGHIAGLVVEECSEASKRYMFEISYGSSYIVVGRWRIISETNNLPVFQSPQCRGAHIPAGETIYYRAMCETAAAKTATVHIRYFLGT